MRAFEHRLVREAFARLAPRDQALLWARDVEGRSIDVLAADYGMTNGAMRVKLARARVRLRVHAAAVGLSSLLPARIIWQWSGEPCGRTGAILPSLVLAFGAMLGGAEPQPAPTSRVSADLSRVPAATPTGPPSVELSRGSHEDEPRAPAGDREPTAPGPDSGGPDRGDLPWIEVGTETPSSEPVATVDLSHYRVPIKVDVWAPGYCCIAMNERRHLLTPDGFPVAPGTGIRTDRNAPD